jgi:exopolysaccharide biosynthesis polyprenyl glycosylphosphotransferase
VSFFFDGDLVISRGWVVASWLALILFVAIGRFLARRIIYRLRARGFAARRIAIIAGEGDAEQLRERFLESPQSGFNVASVIAPQVIAPDTPATEDELSLQDYIVRDDIEEIVVSSASVSQLVLERVVRELAQLPTVLHIVPGMYEIQTTGVNAHEIRGLPLVTLNKVRITGVDFVMKRILDYGVAGMTLLVLSPLIVLLTVLVKTTSPGPVFHRRRVLGERGRPFDALKFRTMYVDGDAILARNPELLERLEEHGKLEDDPRITPVGRWLRRWSLDELPQLLNVIIGQMSLVGPRMITPEELRRFGHWRDNLITVKPGLTGLWQVSGRSNLEYSDRVRLDMYYIRTYSIWQDLEILFRTVPAVLRGVGA